MNIYDEIYASGTITPSDPAARSPLHGGTRSADIRYEPGTSRSCYKCKWGTAHTTDPSKGHCNGMRTPTGGIWRRVVPDYFNMTCDRFAAGEVDFREHV